MLKKIVSPSSAEIADRLPAVFEPTTLILPETVPLQVPQSNALVLTDGLLSVGDGVTVGGISVLGTTRRVSGIKYVDFNGQTKIRAFKRVVPIPITADELVGGKFLCLSGKAAFSQLSVGALVSIKFGLAWEAGSTQPSNGAIGWQNVSAYAGSPLTLPIAVANFAVVAEMYTLSPGNLGLDVDSFVRVVTYAQPYGDGTDPLITDPASGYMNSAYTEETPAGVATNLWLMVEVSSSAGGNYTAGANVLVDYDLTLSVVDNLAAATAV